jgi:hypothetical protein
MIWLLSEAKKLFKKEIANDGIECPCCGRWGKVYGYKLNATIARGLIWMHHNEDEFGWVNIQEGPRWLLRSKSLSTAKHWGLVERRTKDSDEDLRSSGVWRLTKKGVAFVKNRITIEDKVFVFDDAVLKVSKSYTTIDKCLGKKFSYDELMNVRMSDD